jgi:hypothetical protein
VLNPGNPFHSIQARQDEVAYLVERIQKQMRMQIKVDADEASSLSADVGSSSHPVLPDPPVGSCLQPSEAL